MYTSGADDDYSNKGFCYRRFNHDGFDRGHMEQRNDEYPIRLIVNRDVDEFGTNAPRKRQHDKNMLKMISRKGEDKEGKNWTWTPKLY